MTRSVPRHGVLVAMMTLGIVCAVLAVLAAGKSSAAQEEPRLSYNTSSESSTVDIQVVSKQGDDPISDPRVIKTSPTSLEEFNCTPTCRWGDYSSATPDPNVPPLARQGSVWFSNQWVQEPGDEDSAGWGSWNWAAKP